MSRKFDFLKTAKTQPAESLRTEQLEHSDIQVAEMSKPRGRPSGKRTDPDYAQVTAYIRKATHHAVKLRLLQEGQGREFSELVEDLLAVWLSGEAASSTQ